MKIEKMIPAKMAIAGIAVGMMQGPVFAQLNAAPLTFIVDNLYITQSTQSYDRSVNLVKNRSGLLRVFVRANQPNTSRPDIKLNFYYNGILDPTKTRTISANAQMSGIPVQINENDRIANYGLAIPANWITSNLTITAQVDPAGVYTRTVATWPISYAQNRDAPSFFDNSNRQTVVDLANFNTVLVPVTIQKTTTWFGLPVTQTLSTADLSGARSTTLVSKLRDMFPVADTIESSVHEPFTTTGRSQESSATVSQSGFL